MTNAEVRGLLEAKFQGLEGAVLDWQAGKMLRACETAEDAERWLEGLSLQKLVEGYADYRATQASQSAVANYRRELERAEGAKDATTAEVDAVAVPAGGGDAEGEMPSWVRELVEENRKLVERMDALEGERVREERGAVFAQLIDGLPATLRKAYERIPVDSYSKEAFSELCEEVRAEVGTLEQELRARGGRVGFPPVSRASDGGERVLPSKGAGEAFLQQLNLVEKSSEA